MPSGAYASSSAAGAATSAHLLHLPPDLLALVASNLDWARDRLQLEATCRTLLAASRGEHGGTWWGGRRLSLSLLRAKLGNLPFERWREAEQAYTEGVSAWLAARRPEPALLDINGLESEVQLPAPTLPFPPLGLRALHVDYLGFSRRAWDAVMGHSRLTELRVSGCFFERRGEPMRALPALQRLEVQAPGNDEGLPVPPPLCQQLAGCSALTSLSLEFCALGDLPPGLSTLSALCQLALRRDDLRAAARWPDLTTLRALTRLELGRCHLARLPAPLSRCTRLRSLGLQANWDLEGDWGVLRRLTRLTELDLSYHQHMQRLPPVLSALTALETLDLTGCQGLTADAEAWQPLAGHPGLRRLEARACRGLAAVPAALSTLRSLRYLNLACNRGMERGGGWENLTPLTGLTLLWLVGGSLTAVPPQLSGLSSIVHV